MKKIFLLCSVVLLVLTLTSCQKKSEGTTSGPTVKDQLTKVTLQLKWVPQAQFAGYYVAKSKGYYKDEGLDVEIKPGGPDIAPEQIVAAGGADFGVDWLPSLLSARDKGVKIKNIAQLFQKSAMLEIAYKDSGIKTPADFKGKKVGVWFGGNEYELFALLDKNKLNKDKDLEIVKQPFEMTPFLEKKMDAAAAMTYNELQMVYEAGVKPEDLNIISMEQEGVGMLEDGLFVSEKTLQDKKDVAVKFLRASLKGWKYALEHQEETVDIVLTYDTSKVQKKDHQLKMMLEVAKLVDVSDGKNIGYMDPEAFNRTAQIAYKFGVIEKPADSSAYTHDVWNEASK